MGNCHLLALMHLHVSLEMHKVYAYQYKYQSHVFIKTRSVGARPNQWSHYPASFPYLVRGGPSPFGLTVQSTSVYFHFPLFLLPLRSLGAACLGMLEQNGTQVTSLRLC